MFIGVPRETAEGETRVAAAPETVRKLTNQGHRLRVQAGAGLRACIPDGAYVDVGAELTNETGALSCDLVLKVRPPIESELLLMKSGGTLVGMLEPFDRANLERLARAGLTSFALEAAPRTTRAQSMDVLSSQANVAGYKAVMVAAAAYQRFLPMLMTAAGTVKAARVVILGVGVAGLQAIATAKRLGAVIEASDVRPGVKEQVESLGAKFIDVPYETDGEREAAAGVGGYAKPMPASWLDRQKLAVGKSVAAADIVITTALIPGRTAPTLVTEDMLRSMKPGSVVVDLAAGKGADGICGNCTLSESAKTVVRHGVTVIGDSNLAARAAADSSALYARNVIDFLKLLMTKDGALHVPADDDIVSACLMTHAGNLLRN